MLSNKKVSIQLSKAHFRPLLRAHYHWGSEPTSKNAIVLFLREYVQAIDHIHNWTNLNILLFAHYLKSSLALFL